MKDLRFWIEKFHKLTIILEDAFIDIPLYFDRLQKFKNLSTDLEKLKIAFKLQFAKDKKLRKEYRKYMQDNLDFVFFTNALVSTPDMRKFDSENKYMPFTVYIYQVLIWEFSQHFGITLPKSRDIGASYTFNIGNAMLLCESETLSGIYLSKTENDVDITGDRLQTNIGRIRQVIESTTIYDLRKFEINKYLNLFKSEKCGIKGSSTTATAGTGGRFQFAFIDESGVIKNLRQILQSITYSVSRVNLVGTLKPAMDKDFRTAIKDAHHIDIDKYIEMYKTLIVANDYNYRTTINQIISDLKKQVPIGKNITFTITYKHHPLKKGDCDYYKIECNRLLNDPVAISHELEADLNAGSPDRSFYNMTSDNFLTDKEFENIIKHSEGFELIAGFDPGAAKNLALIPMFRVKSTGHYFVFPPEFFFTENENQYNQNSKKQIIKRPQLFLERIIKDYCKKFNRKMTIYAEQSVVGFKSAGYGWSIFIDDFKDYFDLQIVSNRQMTDQLLVVNSVVSDDVYNPIFKKDTKRVLIHEKNKEAFMGFIYGDKNDFSHTSEAFIAAIYGTNLDILQNVTAKWY